MNAHRRALILVAALLAGGARGAEEPPGNPLAPAVEQLRHVVGRWSVITEFLNEDGTIAKAVSGTYEFEWVVADRVVMGRSAIPELDQRSALLFYVNEQKGEIEMASVGADGRLWVMTGPAGGETRSTQRYPAGDGREGQLRFTRFNVSADRFESRMEYTEDGGTTWKPGNHQVFQRQKERQPQG